MWQVLAGVFQLRLFCLLLFVGANDIAQAATEGKSATLSPLPPLLDKTKKTPDNQSLTTVATKMEESQPSRTSRRLAGEKAVDFENLQALDSSAVAAPQGKKQKKKHTKERKDDIAQPPPLLMSAETPTSKGEKALSDARASELDNQAATTDKTVIAAVHDIEATIKAPQAETPADNQLLPSESASLTDAGKHVLSGGANPPEAGAKEPLPSEDSLANEPAVGVEFEPGKDASEVATEEGSVVGEEVASHKEEDGSCGEDTVPHKEDRALDKEDTEVAFETVMTSELATKQDEATGQENEKHVVYEPGMEEEMQQVRIRYELPGKASFSSTWYSDEGVFFSGPILLQPEGMGNHIMHAVLTSDEDTNSLGERYTDVDLKVYVIPASADDHTIYANQQVFNISLRYEQKDTKHSSESSQLSSQLDGMDANLRRRIEKSSLSIPLKKLFLEFDFDDFQELLNVATGEDSNLLSRARDSAVEQPTADFYQQQFEKVIQKIGVVAFVNYMKTGEFHDQLWSALAGSGAEYLAAPSNLILDQLAGSYRELGLGEDRERARLTFDEVMTPLTGQPYNQLTSSPPLYIQRDMFDPEAPVGIYTVVDIDAVKQRVEKILALEKDGGRKALESTTLLEPKGFMVPTETKPLFRLLSKGDDGSILVLHEVYWEPVTEKAAQPIQVADQTQKTRAPVKATRSVGDSFGTVGTSHTNRGQESYIAEWDDEDEKGESVTSTAPQPKTDAAQSSQRSWTWTWPPSWNWGAIIKPWGRR
ncbi:hypothetical protein [Sansalvadorimonas verongulae]|uniref:hypothetical protein n=1 Tax=Sansalvadorimonas verongulae TaxID=2172824 RepID=UPI0012BB6030|nr:hypothetical protein [Sansalvadorimonas verongulae]MTI14077.1 hypothetical protein [Sansalvadorimonas verongulae]